MTVQRDNPYMYATWPTKVHHRRQVLSLGLLVQDPLLQIPEGAQRLRSRALAGRAHRSGGVAHQRA